MSFAVEAAVELLLNGHSSLLHIGVPVAELKGGMAGVCGRGGFRFCGLVLQGHHHKQGEQHLQGEEGAKGNDIVIKLIGLSLASVVSLVSNHLNQVIDG